MFVDVFLSFALKHKKSFWKKSGKIVKISYEIQNEVYYFRRNVSQTRKVFHNFQPIYG